MTTSLFSVLHSLPQRVRVFVAPRYRPEKHYMRGAGPACAARQAAIRATATRH
jgi:hypothetical protein